VNDYLRNKINNISISSLHNLDLDSTRTELDSHANMMVCNDDCYIFDSVYKRSTNVEPFDPSLGVVSSVPIVDVAIAFDCLTTSRTIILIARNVLHVPTMSHNLIHPFILREAGVLVNDVPKIHLDRPSSDDHIRLAKTIGVNIGFCYFGDTSI